MSDIEKILNLRKKYSRELRKPYLEPTDKLILKAKIVALGEALDLLGYNEDHENDHVSVSEYFNSLICGVES